MGGFASKPQTDDAEPGDIALDSWVRYDDKETKAFKLNVERQNGRAAMLGITGCLIHELLGVDALYPTGGLGGAAPPTIVAAVGGKTRSGEVQMFSEGDIGVLPPLGVYDPLGLIETRDMRRYEIMEIKHGRAAMLGFLHVIAIEAGVRLPGYLSVSQDLKFSDVPAGCFASLEAVPTAGWLQIMVLTCMQEAGTGFASKPQTDDAEPGDIALDSWVRYDDPEVRTFKLNAELGVVGLRLGPEASAGLLHARQDHDLEPSGGRDGLERREATRWDIGELEVLRHGEVARTPDSSLDGDDVEEAKHRRAAVLNLHDLVPAHVAGLDETERVVDAQGREHTDVTLGEHLNRARAALNCQSCDDRRRRSAAQAAGRVKRVDAEELVDEAARDAQHSRAAVLALGVELEGPDLGVVVAHPRVERDVAGLGVVGLRLGP